jgi:hypothetical protein
MMNALMLRIAPCASFPPASSTSPTTSGASSWLSMSHALSSSRLIWKS